MSSPESSTVTPLHHTPRAGSDSPRALFCCCADVSTRSRPGVSGCTKPFRLRLQGACMADKAPRQHLGQFANTSHAHGPSGRRTSREHGADHSWDLPRCTRHERSGVRPALILGKASELSCSHAPLNASGGRLTLRRESNCGDLRRSAAPQPQSWLKPPPSDPPAMAPSQPRARAVKIDTSHRSRSAVRHESRRNGSGLIRRRRQECPHRSVEQNVPD